MATFSSLHLFFFFHLEYLFAKLISSLKWSFAEHQQLWPQVTCDRKGCVTAAQADPHNDWSDSVLSFWNLLYIIIKQERLSPHSQIRLRLKIFKKPFHFWGVHRNTFTPLILTTTNTLCRCHCDITQTKTAGLPHICFKCYWEVPHQPQSLKNLYNKHVVFEAFNKLVTGWKLCFAFH